MKTHRGGVVDVLTLLHVCPRDLKSHNVLCTRVLEKDQIKLKFKLADFGLSRLIDQNKQELSTLRPGAGTPAYSSPEVLRGGQITHTCDQWSFAILCWEIMTKKIPWQGHNQIQIFEELTKHNRRPVVPDECPIPMRNLIHRCWELESSNRPEFTEIVSVMMPLVNIRT